MNYVIKKAILLLSIASFLLFPTIAVAEEDSGSSAKPSRFEIKNLIRDRKEEKREKVCDTRAETVVKRSEQLTKRAEMMGENFAKKAEKVKDYYTDKLVPAGVTVANYDALVAAIDTKKAAVDAAVAEANAKASGFDCSDTAALKNQITEYRKAMQKVITALKEYKTSVKNLIVAVRTAAGKVKPSPSPAATP